MKVTSSRGSSGKKNVSPLWPSLGMVIVQIIYMRRICSLIDGQEAVSYIGEPQVLLIIFQFLAKTCGKRV